MRLILKILALPVVVVIGDTLWDMQVPGDRFRRCAGDSFRDCFSGFAGAVFHRWPMGGPCVAGDCVSDQSLWFATGGGLVGRQAGRCELRTAKFHCKLKNGAGHLGVPLLYYYAGAG